MPAKATIKEERVADLDGLVSGNIEIHAWAFQMLEMVEIQVRICRIRKTNA